MRTTFSIPNYVGTASTAPRASLTRFSVWSAEGEAGYFRGGNCTAPPPTFGPEAAGWNTAASGLRIDNVAFFSIPATVGGSYFAVERSLTTAAELMCCISLEAGFSAYRLTRARPRKPKVEFLTVETELSFSSCSVVIVVPLDSWLI